MLSLQTELVAFLYVDFGICEKKLQGFSALYLKTHCRFLRVLYTKKLARFVVPCLQRVLIGSYLRTEVVGFYALYLQTEVSVPLCSTYKHNLGLHCSLLRLQTERISSFMFRLRTEPGGFCMLYLQTQVLGFSVFCLQTELMDIFMLHVYRNFMCLAVIFHSLSHSNSKVNADFFQQPYCLRHQRRELFMVRSQMRVPLNWG
jgi:hypothetical protein